MNEQKSRGYVVRGKNCLGQDVWAVTSDDDASAVWATPRESERMVYTVIGKAIRAATEMAYLDARIFAVQVDGIETPLPTYEEALAEIATTHEALDPIVARRDAVDAPPLPLAGRARTAVCIVEDMAGARETQEKARAAIEALMLADAHLSDHRSRERGLAFSEVLDVFDGKPCPAGDRLKTMEQAMIGLLAKEREKGRDEASASLLSLRVDFRDEKAAAEITPEQASAYLATKGWNLGRTSERFTICTLLKGEETHYISVPLHSDWADYGRRILEAIREAAEVESRSPLAVWWEMHEAKADAAPDPAATLEKLMTDPVLRARFNGSRARIAVLSVPEHPHRPEAARMREYLNAQFSLSIPVADLARALWISETDMAAIEAGEKTTNQAGWEEIQTTLFLLGSGKKPEHIADPESDPSFARALEAFGEEDEAPAPLSMILAVAHIGVIGAGGKLPWRVPEDLKHFKAVTMGHTLIVGRKTYEGLPHLPGRKLVILTCSGTWKIWPQARTIEEAILKARETDPEPIVIGGAEVYRAALPHVTRIYLTEIDRDVEGDTRFELDRTGFHEVERRAGEEPGVTFVVLERA